MDIPVGATADDLFTLLAQGTPDLDRLRRFTTFAVNREVQPPDTPLQAGDEIAFLQPASGGDHD